MKGVKRWGSGFPTPHFSKEQTNKQTNVRREEGKLLTDRQTQRWYLDTMLSVCGFAHAKH
jgi:hypothetical protein